MGEVIDERVRQGRKFASVARDYEQGRPDYPAAALDAAAAALGLDASSLVLDLEAGTGKLTGLLAERFRRVVAVEPLAPMRELLAARLPRVEVRDGTAERLPLGDGEADAVFVAEAFHWFDAAVALAEAARVLAPGGGIALLWQSFDGPAAPAPPEPARELVRDAIARGGEPGGPRVQRGEWREAFPGSRFGEITQERFTHELIRDRDSLISYYLSISSIGGLPEGEREDLRDRLRELIPAGDYRLPLRTELYWARLAPREWCDHCGEALAGADHRACAAVRAMEPPRFCPWCRRRMKVQVLPAGWSATCSVHGDQRESG